MDHTTSTAASVWPNGSVADIDCRQAARRASEASQYLQRAPFSLEKMTWNKTSGQIIYRSSRSWHTKSNFKIFTAGDFLAAAVEHIPPKGQQCCAAMSGIQIGEATPHGRSQTVRYYGFYSNRRRGMDAKARRRHPESPPPPPRTPKAILPAPPAESARALRPLWRDLILRVWGTDPMECPCCHATMKNRGKMMRPEEIRFFLMLHGLWESERSVDRLPKAARRVERSDINASSPCPRRPIHITTSRPSSRWMSHRFRFGLGTTISARGQNFP